MHIEPVRRKKGTGYRVIVKANGQRDSKTFDRKVDALAWGQQREALFQGNAYRELSFQELFDMWLVNHAKVRKAPSSIRGDLKSIQPVLRILGSRKVRDISVRDIDYVLAHIRTLSKKSNVTLNRYLTLVQTIFNYGVRIDCLLKSPVRRDHFLPEYETGYQYWQQQEAEVFLDFVVRKYQTSKSQIALLYLVALNTGMRWGEIIALKWDCVIFHTDSKQSMIIVKRSYCNVSKEIRETTKGYKIRYIGMNESLYEALKAAYAKKDPAKDLVFHTLDGTALRVSNFHQRSFQRDLKEAGVRRIRFHDLRHTYASLFVMNGGSLYDLQKILGHTDVKTTMRYAHLAKEHLLSKAGVVVLGKRDNVVQIDFSQSKKVSL